MNKKEHTFALICFLVLCAIGSLMLILYLYFGDYYMKNCCLLKIWISIVLIACIIFALILVWGSASENPCMEHICNYKYDFVLVHNNKNETIATKSDDFKVLLEKAQNGDLIYFFSDNFSIDSEMLTIKMQDDSLKKIILNYKGNDVFEVIVE